MEFSQEIEPRESPTELIQRLGLPIKNINLISRALTHRSYSNEHDDALLDNERLEFLGDAILDFVVGAWLYNQYPEKEEGELTRIRSALVRTEQLAKFARIMKLNDSIKLGRGEHLAGGRDRDIILCSTFEALIGSIYLELGIEEVQMFVIHFLEKNADEFLEKLDIYDPKSNLQEWSQANKLGIPEYVTTKIAGPEHKRVFEVHVLIEGNVVGIGKGQNKHEASKIAALNALKKINKKDH